MTPDEGLEDCAPEGSTPHHWALEDIIDAHRGGYESELFFTLRQARKPDGYNRKKWDYDCTEYLLKSYVWHRMGKRDQLKECEFAAYKEAYEWMYCQIAPKTLRPSSLDYRNW